MLVEPTVVENDGGSLHPMTSRITIACDQCGTINTIAAVEVTCVYHRPVQAPLRKTGADTRIAFPFASKHYRKLLHSDSKLDAYDLETIFHAAINDFGLATLPIDVTHKSFLCPFAPERDY